MRTFSKLTQSTFVWTLSTIEIFSVEQRARIQKSILGLTSDTKTHGYLETIADMSSTEKPISISFSALGLQFFSILEQRMRESRDTAVLMSDSRNLICLRNRSTTLGLSGDMRWSIYLDARRVWSEERPHDWMR
jgi:hypothetical protein